MPSLMISSPPSLERKRCSVMLQNLHLSTPTTTPGKRMRVSCPLEAPPAPRHHSLEPRHFFPPSPTDHDEELFMPSLMDDTPNKSPLLRAPRPVRLMPRFACYQPYERPPLPPKIVSRPMPQTPPRYPVAVAPRRLFPDTTNKENTTTSTKKSLPKPIGLAPRAQAPGIMAPAVLRRSSSVNMA